MLYISQSAPISSTYTLYPNTYMSVCLSGWLSDCLGNHHEEEKKKNKNKKKKEKYVVIALNLQKKVCLADHFILICNSL